MGGRLKNAHRAVLSLYDGQSRPRGGQSAPVAAGGPLRGRCLEGQQRCDVLRACI